MTQAAVATAPQEKPSFEARPLSSDNKPRVLFIDDSRLIRAAAMKMFGAEFDLLVAENGREGWQIIQSDNDIDVVFTDLVMPEMDGFEVLEKVRTASDEALRQLPVVVITGADNHDDAKAKAYNMGASGFISKPFDAADIRASAQAHINYRQTTEQLQQRTIVDALTGLLNKRGFNAQLEKDLSFSARHRHQLTVLDIHIDAFKTMFVRIGRDGAEQIVKKVGEVISDSVRKEDTVARTGLAQFSVILPAANPDSSLLIAHRISQTVANFKARHKGKLLPISVSAGACIVEPGVHADSQSVIEVACQARETAELRGLGQVESIELGAYRRAQQGQPSTALSIDEVLQEIAAGGGKDVQTHISSVLRELKPIFALLSDDQLRGIANGDYSR